MTRLFVFSIGGTGSRVLKSLVHLLAAGVSLETAEKELVQLVPILIDTDQSNLDTLSCNAFLELYEQIYAERGSVERGAGFFSAPLKRLAGFAEDGSGDISKTFRTNYQTLQNTSFSEFIAFDLISDVQTKHLLQALYSPDNLSEKLTGGFLGNPNVGATVLAGFKDSPDFQLFATTFSAGDRIFIINSIFGGTGAAGLPWLLKKLRSKEQAHGSAETIRNAVIGALTVLPYFKLQPSEESRITSTSFITKTKAALSYYAGYMKGLNALYYIADTVQPTYENNESGEKQENPAHIVELLGALAILEFARTSDSNCTPADRSYYEFGLNDNSDQLSFSSLGDVASYKIRRPMMQLQMLSLLEETHFPESGHQPWAANNQLDDRFFASPGYLGELKTYLASYYRPWIEQLAKNTRSFRPFDLNTKARNMSKLLTGHPAQESFLSSTVGSEMFDKEANALKGTLHGTAGSTARLLDLGWKATGKLTDALLKKIGGRA